MCTWVKNVPATIFLSHLVLPPGAFSQGQVNTYGVGITLVRSSDKSCPYLIFHVAPESPAELAGIKAGDRLLTIDNTDISHLDLAQTVNLISSDRPGSVALKLERKGEIYEVVLQREAISSSLSRQGLKRID